MISSALRVLQAMGPTVQRSVTNSAWVRRLPRDEAEIAVECQRDFGFSVRVRDDASGSERQPRSGWEIRGRASDRQVKRTSTSSLGSAVKADRPRLSKARSIGESGRSESPLVF